MQINGWMDRWVEEQMMDGWVDRLMDGWVELIHE